MLLHLENNGTRKRVQAEIIQGKLWVYMDGKTYCLETETSGRSRKVGSAKSPDKITSPMPGKITKVLVSEGQVIRKGDSLVVMEAMKMEYTLKSEADGTVEKIDAKAADQVVLGKLLVQLKIEKSET